MTTEFTNIKERLEIITVNAEKNGGIKIITDQIIGKDKSVQKKNK